MGVVDLFLLVNSTILTQIDWTVHLHIKALLQQLSKDLIWQGIFFRLDV